jgi:hypothetical protein
MHADPVARFVRNSGGNKVEAYSSMPVPGGHLLNLRGPVEAVHQLLACAAYQEVPINWADPQWTHQLNGPGVTPGAQAQELLDLLRDVVTLPEAEHLDFALALDWYKVPEEGVPGEQWPNTEVGELVTRGKYWYKADPERQREVGRKLVASMLAVIRRHPVLRRVDLVLDVPGHDATRVSFGSRVADAISRDLHVGLSRVQCTDIFRPEAKAMSIYERRQRVAGRFCCADLPDRAVMIIDDVYSSGATMSEVARAARAAGAAFVYGFAAVRTMRR